MSWGRDIRLKDLVMIQAPVEGGLEPRLLVPTRREVRARVLERVPAYTPEWTNRRPDDAGVALVAAYGTVVEAVNTRLNRVPRKLLLDHLELAGVRPLTARPASAVVAVQVAGGATAPVDVPAATVFLAPGGDVPVVLETEHACHALPGTISSVAVFSDGVVVNDTPDQLGGLPPFGDHPAAGADLWVGIESTVAPSGLLSVAVELLPPPGRPAFAAVATTAPPPPPMIRWEAVTGGGATELPVERDDTGGLAHSGVVQLRVDLPGEWAPGTLPGRREDPPLRWLRARLVTSSFPPDRRLARVTLNGVPARASRSVRDEVLEPLDRRASGRARFRLSQTPVVPGSIVLEVADAAAGPAETERTEWSEVDDLASAGPEDRVFLLDAAAGILTFGDGTAGRAVPPGYRNVISRVYQTGGGSAGLPKPGDTLAAQQSIPNLSGALVLSITTGAEAETAGEISRRGPAEILSRRRAVAPADYATVALGAEGVDIARAHCLPVRDPRSPGGSVPGLVGVVVVPQVLETDQPPMPDEETLRAVADHLARQAGVVGAEVVATAPRYREVVVHALLSARAGSDTSAVASATRDAIDRWLDPLVGGDGAGWPFGEPVQWDALTRLLLREISELTAVSQLSFRVAGRRLAPCVNVELEPDELPWPGSHVLEVVTERRVP